MALYNLYKKLDGFIKFYLITCLKFEAKFLKNILEKWFLNVLRRAPFFSRKQNSATSSSCKQKLRPLLDLTIQTKNKTQVSSLCSVAIATQKIENDVSIAKNLYRKLLTNWEEISKIVDILLLSKIVSVSLPT